MAGSSENGDRSAASTPSSGRRSGPPWRVPFDAVERPVSAASQSWVQSAPFMDSLALAWRIQRRVNVEVRRGLGAWLGALNLSSRSDVDRLSNQLANVERQIRELRSELEGPGRRRPAGRDRP